MTGEAVTIGGLIAPLLVAIRWAQVGDHDGDSLARTSAVALTGGGDCVCVGELVTCATATATVRG